MVKKGNMKFKFVLTALLSLNIAFSQNAPLNTDWYYSGIHHPAQKTIIHEYDENGAELQKIETLFNPQGFITDNIYNDELRQDFEPYIGNQRVSYFTYLIDGQPIQQKLTETWIADDVLRLDDEDLVIETYFDPLGRISKENLFLDNFNAPKESSHYHYLESAEIMPTNIGNKDVYITILESDNFGSWTRQKEEKFNQKTIIRTRTIEYFP